MIIFFFHSLVLFLNHLLLLLLFVLFFFYLSWWWQEKVKVRASALYSLELYLQSGHLLAVTKRSRVYKRGLTAAIILWYLLHTCDIQQIERPCSSVRMIRRQWYKSNICGGWWASDNLLLLWLLMSLNAECNNNNHHEICYGHMMSPSSVYTYANWSHILTLP